MEFLENNLVVISIALFLVVLIIISVILDIQKKSRHKNSKRTGKDVGQTDHSSQEELAQYRPEQDIRRDNLRKYHSAWPDSACGKICKTEVDLIKNAGTKDPAQHIKTLSEAHQLLLPKLDKILNKKDYCGMYYWGMAANALAEAEQDKTRQRELFALSDRLLTTCAPHCPDYLLPAYELTSNAVHLAAFDTSAQARLERYKAALGLLGATHPDDFKYLLDPEEEFEQILRDGPYPGPPTPRYRLSPDNKDDVHDNLWLLKHGEAVLLKLLAQDLPPGKERDFLHRQSLRMMTASVKNCSYLIPHNLDVSKVYFYVRHFEDLVSMHPEPPEPRFLLERLYRELLRAEQNEALKTNWIQKIVACNNDLFSNPEYAVKYYGGYLNWLISIPAPDLHAWWRNVRKALHWHLQRMQDQPDKPSIVTVACTYILLITMQLYRLEAMFGSYDKGNSLADKIHATFIKTTYTLPHPEALKDAGKALPATTIERDESFARWEQLLAGLFPHSAAALPDASTQLSPLIQNPLSFDELLSRPVSSAEAPQDAGKTEADRLSEMPEQPEALFMELLGKAKNELLDRAVKLSEDLLLKHPQDQSVLRNRNDVVKQARELRQGSAC